MNPKKKVIETTVLKEIQLEILSAVHKFCIENDIKYSLACGTLIGAVRHKGYIPWDDDIDICLLRDEYKKLEVAFPKILDGKYKFLTLNRDCEWYMPWGKIVDNRTALTEEVRYLDKNWGVFIDVFPIDDVPDNNCVFFVWNHFRKYLLRRWYYKNGRWNRQWKIKTKVRNFLRRIYLFPFSMRRIGKIIDFYIQRPNGRGFNHICHSCEAMFAKHNLNKEVFNDYIDIEFENRKFKTMVGYDSYLRAIYGDYMKLPPEEQRVTHHFFKAFWK